MTQQTRIRAVAVAAALPLVLAGCAGGGGAVGFDGVQSATIQIEAAGTFVSPEGAAEVAGRGSGFLISDEGLAVTNNHVVVGAGTLKVWVGGETDKTYNAKVLGASECLDLAVIKLDDGTYPFLTWQSGDITTAEEVYAAGFPLGDPEFTLTKGIISKASASGETAWASIDGVVEHDARIRPGNSGGPLVNSEGRVVGVNYASWSEVDYSYAISRDEVTPIIRDLIKGEDVLSIGINGEALAPDDEGNPQGIWVASVKSGSPADKAGIQAGDVLTRLQGITVGAEGTLTDYCDVLRTQGIDATMDATVYRPSEEVYYRGQINGDALEAIVVPGGGEAGGDEGGTGSGEYVTVSDDSGAVSVEVPVEWSEVRGESFVDDAGATWYDVTASANVQSFYDTWDNGGVIVSASTDAAGTSLQDLLNARTPGEGVCASAETDVYDDDYYVGQFSYFTGCGSTASDYVIIAANSPDNSHVIAVTVALTPSDSSEILERVVGSFIAEF